MTIVINIMAGIVYHGRLSNSISEIPNSYSLRLRDIFIIAYDKRNVANVIKLRILRQGDYPDGCNVII